MAVRNFLSGVESTQHYQACLDAKAKHVLVSYLYVQKKGLDVIKDRKNRNPEVNFLVDSGAHTFQTDAAKFSSWSLADYERYVQSYVKWLEANRAYLFAAVELDIDFNVGTSTVEGWQQRYFVPLQESLPIIFVWHAQRGLEGWEEMCSKYPYVGLPGEMSGEADFNKYMTVAKRYMTLVHGFAATKQADFRDWPWASVDSITWKTSEMYGTLIDWDDHSQKLRYDPIKANRANYRDKFISFGLDAEGIITDTAYKEVTKYALISMTRMEAFYANRYKDRTFYYERRLPQPKRCLKIKDKKTRRLWQSLDPSKSFGQHIGEANPVNIRKFLYAISCVQNRRADLLKGDADALSF